MRLSVFITLLLAGSLSLFATSNSLGQSIYQSKTELGFTNITLKAALEQVEKKTGFHVFYSTPQVETAAEISVNAARRTVAQLLDVLLKEAGLTYRQEGTAIIIMPKTAVVQHGISGIVVDENGIPLPGVTVMVKGNNRISTATDLNGHFGLQVGDSENTLVFKYLGYADQEQLVAKNTTALRVVMKAVSGSLDEVQIIGYGQTTRRLNTGAVSSITSEEISKQTVANPIHAMAGRIAGVTITQNNGLPGSNSTVTIRGNNTFGSYGLSGSIPLYIVDGTPFTNFNTTLPINDNLNNSGLTGANGGLSVFGFINPQDIERIDVLKDADATAIYGARGANGVVLITTKKGKSGKTQLNANVYSGVGEVGNFVELLNTQQYLELRREAFKNDGVTATTANAPDLLEWDQNAYTDWQKFLIGGTAKTTDAQFNYSGGNERVQFFTSANYRKDGTVYPGDMGSKRLSGRMTVTTNSVNNKFQTNISANYTNDVTDLITSDISSALYLPPNYPLYKADGTLYWGAGFTNPLSNLLKTYNSTTGNFVANGDLRYTFFKGFSAKVNLGYTRTSLAQSTANPLSSQNPSSATSNSAAFANSLATNYIAEPQLHYTRQIGKGTFLGILGSTFQQNISDATRINASNYAYEALLTSVNGAGTITSTNAFSDYRYGSFFGKLNYEYDKKYIINATFRRDASSRFGANNRFANFGALGAAWIFTDEAFLKDKIKFLSFGKLRGSYGTTGNDQLPNYSFLSLFTAGTAYQGNTTLTVSSLANPDLRWETTKKLEFGLELGFLKDRIIFKTDLYWHRSGNLLTYGSPPNQTGYNSININMDAVIQNKGLEFELSSTNIITDNFRWNSAFNISFQNNKMLSFADKAKSFYGTTFEVGYPVPPTRLFSYGGIAPTTGAVIMNDLDGNPVVNFTTDRYIADIGTPYFGGLNNTFSYKNVSLDVFLQFNHRKGTINQIAGTRIGSLNNQNISVLDRWRQAGDVGTLFPGASANSGSGAIYSTYTYLGQSDFFYGDASFLKLRSASLSYNFSQKLIKPIGINNARLYLQGQNLLTFAKNKYLLDPESGNAMPPLRTIVLGVNLTL